MQPDHDGPVRVGQAGSPDIQDQTILAHPAGPDQVRNRHCWSAGGQLRSILRRGRSDLQSVPHSFPCFRCLRWEESLDASSGCAIANTLEGIDSFREYTAELTEARRYDGARGIIGGKVANERRTKHILSDGSS